jgi:hypothetical protein
VTLNLETPAGRELFRTLTQTNCGSVAIIGGSTIPSPVPRGTWGRPLPFLPHPPCSARRHAWGNIMPMCMVHSWGRVRPRLPSIPKRKCFANV